MQTAMDTDVKSNFYPPLFFRRMVCALLLCLLSAAAHAQNDPGQSPRQRILIDQGWRFMRYPGQDSLGQDQEPDSLYYDKRPQVTDHNDQKVADTRADITGKTGGVGGVKSWILPTANKFIKDTADWYPHPVGKSPGQDFAFVQADFNDGHWQKVNLPHDWAIDKEFYKGDPVPVGGGMGRLPVQGVAWYRKKLNIPAADKGKRIFLDMDGAMSYAEVWLNGHLVGGWPYGYSSFRLDLTAFVHPGGMNQLAIRLDNPASSSRWYPGAGIYRNVWLVKVNPVHIDQYGTYVTTQEVSANKALVRLEVKLNNQSGNTADLRVVSSVYALDEKGNVTGEPLAGFTPVELRLAKGKAATALATAQLNNPRLWQPVGFTKDINRYQASRYEIRSLVYNQKGQLLDEYQTKFGIRDIQYDANRGLIVNGHKVRIQGVNQHHDLGALGAAFNRSAALRQLEILKEMGCNAIRFSHNPPDPQLLDLTDSMGLLVIDEINDCWQKGKNPLDFHLIFDDWYEALLRSFVRRDRNHPSIMQWSFGNEVGEQYTDSAGAALAKRLHDIVHEEDPTRPASASMNYARPLMPFGRVMDVLNLNYQGEGIRDAPAYAGLQGIHTSPLYDSFHHQFADKMIISSESASTLSTRGTYVFPVTKYNSAPASDTSGGDPRNLWVSDYGLYTAAFGASPDKVFAAQDQHPFVAGEFVWSGFDYLGEPTPYYAAKGSYSGIIDLAGFKKDRYYLYQARWRPDYPMAHILPSWTLPGREGIVTPVHVFSSGDEAELFINGISQGKRYKTPYTYRFRWDSAVYEPGNIKVVTYKNGKLWATESLNTAGAPAAIRLTANTDTIHLAERSLAFIKAEVIDDKGNLVPDAQNSIHFTIRAVEADTDANARQVKIWATDNGDPADLHCFASDNRKAFSGKALCIVGPSSTNKENKLANDRDSYKVERAIIYIDAECEGLKSARLPIYINQ
ncbi:beta-galactosidase [Arachidicoccus rhizosphaerae]|uniref:Beta-galactosidase n=2 Tax=Arachidicoccus rhizosphaerae TaxID=551991 RepID=A0A1H3VEF6_9BACT|nr:beta-galactosidase [Arachidicoccus rhizosphaerae]